MKKLKAIMAAVTAMTLTMGAVGVTAYAERKSSDASFARSFLDENASIKTYVYEKEGFGGDFTINLGEDGKYSYYEGALSSYVESGTWEQSGNIITLTSGNFVNRLKADGNDLIFIEEGSSNFYYTTVKDGERFSLADADEGEYSFEDILDNVSSYLEDPTVEYKLPSDELESVRGDANRDGEIDERDVACIINRLGLGDFECIFAEADFNEDGVVNVKDAALIQEKIIDDMANEKLEDDLIAAIENVSEDDSIDDISDMLSEYIEKKAPEEELDKLTGIRGDVNNDGEVTVQDGALIAKYLANRKYMTQEEFDALTVQGDFNGDGQVNARDIRDITKYRVDMFKNKSSEKENYEDLMKELSELDPDTPIEDIESIISEYVNDNTSEEEETVNTEPTGIIGDVNYDGVLTIRDAALIAKYMSHPEYLTDAQINAVTAQGDFNGDGRVSVRDASDIVKYIAKSAKDKENTVSTEPAEIIPGDMNGDGVVSFRDAAIIAKYLANLKIHPELEETLKKGDFNGDGITNVRDYAAILEHLVENGVFGDRYKTWKDIVWREGDANLDDVFDLTDLVLTTKYALSPASFPLENEVAFVNADMNSDDKIDSVDINKMIEKQLGK